VKGAGTGSTTCLFSNYKQILKRHPRSIMYLSNVQIKNFRNFSSIDLVLHPNVVMVGENRVGKSNFIFALRLVLDVTLPDAARQLKLSDIWDGCDLSTSPEVSIHLDFADFDGDPNLVALMTDYRLASDHTKARLSYVFRKKAEITTPPSSEIDYEYKVYGGDDESRAVRNDVRRRICLDVLHALRDAEAELGAWRSSPLRPLLEDAIGSVPKAALKKIVADIAAATKKLGVLGPIKTLETDLRQDIGELAGASQDIRAKLGFAPSDPLRLFRSIGLFIDDGKRGIAEASVGSANVAFLAIKLAEFAWRHLKNERNYTLVCVEEPEAHLHPHLQRRVFQKLFMQQKDLPRGLFLTTHSPNIASVVPLNSIVLLKCGIDKKTEAYSLARLALSAVDLEDLQRYLDTTRAEILFSRGVVFVEGDAEAALVPVFAKSIGYDLDELGISVCNVGGVNFSPYVRLAAALSLPFVVITDWDPLDGTKPPLGRKRTLDLIDDILKMKGKEQLTPAKRATFEANDTQLRKHLKTVGLFVNTSTLELEISKSKALISALLSILEAESFGSCRKKRLNKWKTDWKSVDGEQLLAMVADVGKGRLAGRLAAKATGLTPPTYIKDAVRCIAGNV
jgi:putative ATP-dependent endonuclease of the OLD family